MKKMIYPAFIQPGHTVGITAPSDGNGKELDYIRLDNGIRTLKNKGYHVIETENVRTSQKGRSSNACTRAEQFMSLWNNKEVKAVFSAKGGDYAFEMLSLLDWEQIAENPKWFQGYSDNTSLTYTLTTCCNIASVYGNNFNDFGMENWHTAVENNWNILEGQLVEQQSFDYYEADFHDKETGLEAYAKDAPVKWTHAGKAQMVTVKGRLLGGCLDVLLELVGTRFDKTKEFCESHKEEGILWYLESFDLNSEAMAIGLWHLREAGWFEHANGFVFGRPCMYSSYYDISYQEAVLSVLEPLGLPIIFDADIGHRGPQFTMINGAMATVTSCAGKGMMKMELR